MEDALKNALTSIAEFVPKLVAFLLILLAPTRSAP